MALPAQSANTNPNDIGSVLATLATRQGNRQKGRR